MNEQTHLNIAALLSHVPLFSGLDTGEIARIARGTREIHVAKGDILFHKGDTSTGFHLLVYGQIKLAFTSSQGSEKVVDIMGPGQTFGQGSKREKQDSQNQPQAHQSIPRSKAATLKYIRFAAHG